MPPARTNELVNAISPKLGAGGRNTARQACTMRLVTAEQVRELGTGVKDAPRGAYAQAIQAINALDCPIIAVDVPSGVDADMGFTRGDAVCATHTVTFAYPKLGLFLFPGAQNTGKLTVSDIGFPW